MLKDTLCAFGVLLLFLLGVLVVWHLRQPVDLHDHVPPSLTVIPLEGER